MTTASLPLWMSMGKPLVAVLAAKLVDAGKLDLHRPVADLIDGFDAGGKGGVTPAHVLTHTGGFRNVGSNWSPEPWPAAVARVAAAPLEDGWTPGETAGYHVSSGWYVLTECCRIALGVEPTDAAVSRMLRDELMVPLGMTDCHVGMTRGQYLDYGTRLGLTYDTSKEEPKPLAFPNSEAGFLLCRPGGNARGPVRQLGRFYEQLLVDRGDLRSEISHLRFLSRETARLFTSRQRTGLKDRTFGADIDWGYGFLMADPDGGRIPYGYGPHASPETFGHSGNQSSCGFADPPRKLVACWATNGLPGELAHQKRQHAANAAIYEDLGLLQ